jgi:hypothetical protein
MPCPRRHPTVVVGTVDIPNRRPCPDVHNSPVRGRTCVSADFPRRLNDRFNTIDVFIANDLEHSLSVGEFLQLDHGNILVFPLRNNSLKNKGVYVSFVPVEYPDIINKAITIKIEVVHLRVRRVEHFFKFLRRFRFLEELQSTFQAEMVTRDFGFLGIGCYPSRHHQSHHRQHSNSFHKRVVIVH